MYERKGWKSNDDDDDDNDNDEDADDDNDNGDDDGDDDDGLPPHSQQSYSHQVGIYHDDEEWEYDTVEFLPNTWIRVSSLGK